MLSNSASDGPSLFSSTSNLDKLSPHTFSDASARSIDSRICMCGISLSGFTSEGIPSEGIPSPVSRDRGRTVCGDRGTPLCGDRGGPSGVTGVFLATPLSPVTGVRLFSLPNTILRMPFNSALFFHLLIGLMRRSVVQSFNLVFAGETC